jgi:uncharacterized Zn finger protein
MAKWLVCQACGKSLTTVRVKHGTEVHFTNRTVHCTHCGHLNILNGDYMSP